MLAARSDEQRRIAARTAAVERTTGRKTVLLAAAAADTIDRKLALPRLHLRGWPGHRTLLAPWAPAIPTPIQTLLIIAFGKREFYGFLQRNNEIFLYNLVVLLIFKRKTYYYNL